VLQLSASSDHRFLPLPEGALDVFSRTVSELANCKGISGELVHELKESRGKIFVGGRTKWTGDENGLVNTTLIVQNLDHCSWSDCVTHFFKGNPSRNTCEYVFTTRAYKGIGYTGSFFLTDDPKYKSDCAVYFNGSCFIKENWPS
jgi:hypothetical protein